MHPLTAAVLAILLSFAPLRALAQVDSIGGVFRDVLIEISKAGGLSRLDSSALTHSVTREVRIYTGFGIGVPHYVTRVWQGERGVHGAFGVFWPSSLPRGFDSSTVMKFDEQMRALIATSYQCTDIRKSPTISVCWLPEHRAFDRWAELLTQLDRLGVDTIPVPIEPKLGNDGWTIVVEVRTTTQYRAYSYWAPAPAATDPAERAAASIGDAVSAAWRQRLGK
jgi:hypothetical protein